MRSHCFILLFLFPGVPWQGKRQGSLPGILPGPRESEVGSNYVGPVGPGLAGSGAGWLLAGFRLAFGLTPRSGLASA